MCLYYIMGNKHSFIILFCSNLCESDTIICLFVYFLVKKIPLRNYLPRTSSASFVSIATSNVIKNMINTASFIAIFDSAEQNKGITSVGFGIVDCFRIIFLL